MKSCHRGSELASIREFLPSQIRSALEIEREAKIAKQAGVTGGEASSALAAMLPNLIDKLSPDGRSTKTKGLDDLLSKVLGAGRLRASRGDRHAPSSVR